MVWLEVLLWLSVIGIISTYALYPLAIRLLAGKETLTPPSVTDAQLPGISVLIAVHNEEKTIAAKLNNILDTDYPADKIEIWVGSDHSTDQTDAIVSAFAQTYPNIYLKSYPKRQGKSPVINKLVEHATHPILVLTDAKIRFEHTTLRHLVRHFENPAVGVVSARMAVRLPRTGTQTQEKTYFDLEAKAKFHESVLFQGMIGAYGGGYAIRKADYTPTPPLCIADDFFISMKVLEHRRQALLDPDAIGYINPTDKSRNEFRRKARIAVGSFQNLWYLRQFFFKAKPVVVVAYVFHKILRWFSPFLLLIAFVTNLLLWGFSLFYTVTAIVQLSIIGLALLDGLIKLLIRKPTPLKFLSHFYLMNIAMCWGFVRYLRGVKSPAWEPSKRTL